MLGGAAQGKESKLKDTAEESRCGTGLCRGIPEISERRAKRAAEHNTGHRPSQALTGLKIIRK
jgi:hypothetical protein